MGARKAPRAPRRTPSQRRAQDTVDVLLEATERVLGKHGFEATTTNRIAEAAGVSIGTLYHYFPSKEALVEALVHRMWEREIAVLEDRRALLAEAPLADAVHELVGLLVALMLDRVGLYHRWYNEAPHLGRVDLGLAIAERANGFLREALAARRAELRVEDLDFAVDLVVKTVLAQVRTAARDWLPEAKSGKLAREVADMVARYLLA